MELFFYITVGWCIAFLLAIFWWSRSTSIYADVVFLVLLIAGTLYVPVMMVFGTTNGWLGEAILMFGMMSLLVYANFRFAKIISPKRQYIINNNSA